MGSGERDAGIFSWLQDSFPSVVEIRRGGNLRVLTELPYVWYLRGLGVTVGPVRVWMASANS